ncbi:SF1B family DNA helicase RecD2 [Fluviispira multicolorata]|uniref:AAA family ATPase n=1 Tax=Fluviispira multicolorata TaxID=2654512 RepID=A0A833JEE7_9BACT|nr:AAA family ATPase [Fluviispira multicolorata]KAB8029809.1 AAA family ATPase [Fluviispira multicolorata]
MSLEVVGMLSKVIFESERGDFLVAEFIDALSAKRFRASGKIQVSPKADAKQRYRIIGQWENSPKYGETFVAIYSEPTRPQELSGIAPYLANNVKGVGEVTAKKLVDALQIKNIDDLVAICRDEKEKIFQYFGGKKRKVAENVITVMVTDEVFRNVMIFLHEHNIPPRFAKRIYEKYGVASLTNLMENPYRLIADFRQVGFLRADAIAQKLGLPTTSPFRIEAAFIYALEIAQEEGHCCLPRDNLIDKARDLLGGKFDPTFSREFTLEQLRSIYKKNREEKKETFLIRETTNFKSLQNNTIQEILFYLPEVLRMEDEVAGFIQGLLKIPPLFEHKEKLVQSDIVKGEKTFEELFPGVPWEKLSSEQQAAVQMSLSSRFMVLTGGPGCGKTFVLKAIYGVQRALNRRVALCAPTGLAAKRMTASIGEQASTLHKMLGLGRRNKDETQNVIEELEGNTGALDNVDVVIVDESSMLSLDLLHSLLSVLGPNRRLILVGDVDQLPSVGAGNCLRDIISSAQAPIARLTQIFRQSSESPIPLAAREIISGKKPEYSYISRIPVFPRPESFAFIPCSQQTFFDVLIPFLCETVKNIYELDPLKNCQILVPMRRTEVGQENINKIIQNHLNPPSENKKEYSLPYGSILREGDKVIQIKNNYELDVFNGDLGYCKTIIKTKEKVEATVEFSDRVVIYEDEEIDDLQLCYSMTVHKSQGSEFPLCIIPMFGVYFTMLDRNLLYTAITRASKYVILVGEDWAVKKAVGSQNAIRRFTFLDRLLLGHQDQEIKN